MTFDKESYLLPIPTHDFHIARKFIIDLFETQYLMDMLVKYGGYLPSIARAANISPEELNELLVRHKIDHTKFHT